MFYRVRKKESYANLFFRHTWRRTVGYEKLSFGRQYKKYIVRKVENIPVSRCERVGSLPAKCLFFPLEFLKYVDFSQFVGTIRVGK